MKTRNMTSKRGNKVLNQFEIEDYPRAKYFQSYNSIIVKVDYKKGQTYLDERYWDYSRTTGMYRNLFLGEKISETRNKIKDGTYKLTNLNK